MDNYKKTNFAFIGSNVFNAALWAMYSLLIFIFYKDLHASAWQITLLISIKPAVAIFSFYWSSFLDKRPDLLKSNIFWATFVGFFPCFFFPFIDNIWFYIFAYAAYMMSIRAIIPGWMEILKINVPAELRSKVFSHGSSTNYLAGLLFPIAAATWMDTDVSMWRWLFPASALSSFLGLFLLLRIPIDTTLRTPESLDTRFSFKNSLIKPWKGFWILMKQRPDFAHFQWIFMFGGLGIMIMQPALPQFFIEVLKLSYTELAIAFSICKGLGFALTSRFWANLMNRINLYSLTSIVTLCAGIFPFLIMAAETHWLWVFGAYLLYGMMQAGSELSWNLSGPIFAKEQDSSTFSGVNVMLVGIRGCIGPTIGAYLVVMTNTFTPLMIGALFCFFAAGYALYCSKKFASEPLVAPIISIDS